MKITPIRVLYKGTLLGPGTGRDEGHEVYPTTDSLLKHFSLSNEDKLVIKTKQQKRMEDLPECESINNLREYQLEDIKFLGEN